MSGIESSDSFILPREREKRRKLILNAKLFSGLLLSNVLTLLLFLPAEEVSEEKKALPRQGFQLLELHLNNFTRTSGAERATLFSGEDVLIRDVTIHHHLSKGGTPPLYLVEVPESTLSKIVQYKGDPLSAFPFGDYPFKKKSISKGVSYEIRF